MEALKLIVVLFGAVIVGFGAFGVVRPTKLVSWLGSFWKKDHLWLAVVLRLVLGAILLYVAPETRAPSVVRLLGVVSVLAGLGLLAIGRERMQAIAGWWLQRPPAFVRCWAVAALLFGGLLAYAGL